MTSFPTQVQGSGVSPWFDSLPPTVEACPVELPGRGARLMEPPFTCHIFPLIQAIAPALLAHFSSGQTIYLFWSQHRCTALSLPVYSVERKHGLPQRTCLYPVAARLRFPDLRIRLSALPEPAFEETTPF